MAEDSGDESRELIDDLLREHHCEEQGIGRTLLAGIVAGVILFFFGSSPELVLISVLITVAAFATLWDT